MARSLRRALASLCFVSITLLASGCGPEKLVQWSPDGARATVISSGKLYICEAGGNLTGPPEGRVERVAWLPDSRHVAAVFVREVDSWEELVRTAPIDFDEKKIIAAAGAAREELIGYIGNLDDFKPSNARQLTMQQWLAGMLYLRLQADPRFKERVGKDWKEFEGMKVEVRSVRLIPAPAATGEEGIPLFDTLDDIDEVRASPDGRCLALVARHSEGWEESEDRTLLVLQTGAAAKPLVAAGHVSSYPDWSADGRDLVFARRREPDQDGLGCIARRAVRDDKGALLENPPEVRDLAEVVFGKDLKVRCLRDGRVLFAAAEVSLPAGITGAPRRLTLFTLDPAGTPTVRRVFPPAVDARIPDRVDLFELSPDETRAAIPGSKGKVSVASLSTGEVAEVVDNSPQGDLRTVPVWRSAGQLCLLAPAGSAYASPKRDELILWSPARTAVLSRGWPDEVINGIK